MKVKECEKSKFGTFFVHYIAEIWILIICYITYYSILHYNVIYLNLHSFCIKLFIPDDCNFHQPPLNYDSGVFFIFMKKVIVLVDGFNLYHSITDLEFREKIKVKWLDINSLCNSYLYLFGKDAIIEELYFFTAFPHHRISKDSDIINRHKKYLRCLEDTGLKIIYGRFKSKMSFCPECRKRSEKFEEKETDVAISIKLFELLHNNKADIFLLITGDTDLSPAIKTCKSLFPLKTILFAFPYRRKNNELAKLAPGSFTIRSMQYSNHLFNDPYTLSDGREISKPSTW